MTTKKEYLHLIGIGGSGMTALANLLLSKGYSVSGSDKNDFPARKDLEKQGVKIYIGHGVGNIKKPQAVIYSSAISKDNTELLQARKKHIPLFNRFDFLIKILTEKKIIAIAGTHGKTTTTAMVAYILEKSGLEPTVYLGAKNKDWPLGSKWGRGEYAVIETDEHDKSFLKTPAFLSLITNVDTDHLSVNGPYQTKFSLLKKAFRDFAEHNSTQFVILNNDDNFLRKLGGKSKKNILSFGIDKKADLTAKNIHYDGRNSKSDLFFKENYQGKLNISIPEKENIYNALGAINASYFIGVSFKDSLKHLKNFSGVKRRFSIIYNKKIAIVDDYAHHPTEIKSTLKMAHRVFPKRRIILILEPHRYSRISFLYKCYAPAVENCDILFLLPIDPANEKPIPGVKSEKIYQEVLKTKSLKKNQLYLANNSSELFEKLLLFLKKGDVIIFAGPGKIATLPHKFINFLKRQNEKKF
ncbi:MAG: UDP-N-acetylmuramate--L-alanine ligase [Candidatus Pacebacteria bacterium]|nr:UDP-N-acetylmuramate--L-alanine ligase [Candidatus Paceibacterota bacterium]